MIRRDQFFMRSLLLCLMLTLLPVGCGRVMKRTTRIEAPVAQKQARDSNLTELIQLINESYASLESLIAIMDLEFQADSATGDYNERYRKANARLISRRPDSIYINVLNPLTRTTVLTMASSRGIFQVWVPRENKYFTGSTGLENNDENPLYNVRPDHVLPALLVEPLHSNLKVKIFLEEAEDSLYKYYVINVVEKHLGTLSLKRKLWIERSKMALVRQKYYDVKGKIVSNIHYTSPVDLESKKVNAGVILERTRERYTLRLQLNPGSLDTSRKVKEASFRVPVPPSAEVVNIQ